MTNTEISQMTVIERLKIMEALWESLTQSTQTAQTAQTTPAMQPPAWHKTELLKRKTAIKRDEQDFISLDELKSHHGKNGA